MEQEKIEQQNFDLNEGGAQRELEKLSWEFLLKEKEEEEFKRALDKENEQKHYYQAEKIRGAEEDLYGESPSDDRNFDFWQRDEEQNINNWRRETGIIFNEERLEKHRVMEWKKAPRLREPAHKIFFGAVVKILFWPIGLVARFLSAAFKIFNKSIRWFLYGVYKFLVGTMLIFWQTIMAFKHVFIYLFGDFSWLKKEKEEPFDNKPSVEGRKNYLLTYRPERLALAFAGVALLLVLPIKIYFFYQQTERVKGEVLGASKEGASHLIQAGLAGKNFNIGEMEKEFNLAGQEFRGAQNNFKELGIVANSASAIIPEVELAKKLLEIATKAADIGWRLSETTKSFGLMAEGVKDDNGESTGLEGNFIKIKADTKSKIDWLGIENNLNIALEEVGELEAELATVDLTNTEFSFYGEQLEAVRRQMPRMARVIENYRDLTKIFLTLIGADEPKRWLLVFQNNTEIRPTGGFMGSYAVVDVYRGGIKQIVVPGGGFYDLKGSLAVRVDAPYPFHFFSAIWQPWNANWFPDWPTSAKKIMWFYDKSGGPSVDGVISFTPDVLAKLLELTGPIEMSDYQTTIDSDNFLRNIQTEVEINYDKKENKPKKIIGDLLPKLLAKVLKLEGERGLEAVEKIFGSLAEKDILIYMKDAEAQKIVDDFYWSGRLQDYDKDYLAVVHTNIAGGKTDGVIKNTIEHETEITNAGEIIDTVILTREHQGRPGDIFESSTNTDFVRFYVPQGSKLLTAEGFDGLPAGRQFQVATSGVEADPLLVKIENNLRLEENSGTRIVDEFGKTSFGNWITVAPGETQRVRVKYLLPWRLGRDSDLAISSGDEVGFWSLLKKYFIGGKKEESAADKKDEIHAFLIQKQPGTSADEFVAVLKVGDQWQIDDYLPVDGAGIQAGVFRVNFAMDGDKYYGVAIRKK